MIAKFSEDKLNKLLLYIGQSPSACASGNERGGDSSDRHVFVMRMWHENVARASNKTKDINNTMI